MRFPSFLLLSCPHKRKNSTYKCNIACVRACVRIARIVRACAEREGGFKGVIGTKNADCHLWTWLRTWPRAWPRTRLRSCPRSYTCDGSTSAACACVRACVPGLHVRPEQRWGSRRKRVIWSHHSLAITDTVKREEEAPQHQGRPAF